MAKSKVWYSPGGATVWPEALPCKAKDLFYEAGFDKMIEPGDSVAVKIHCGEWNRTACLRPELVAAIVEEVKKCGGEPFVTDTTTLTYFLTNSRTNGPLAMETANRHGFNPASLGCPYVIADGYYGIDDVRVELPEGNILKDSYVARALAQADVCINLAHGKGHPFTAMGACIKNFGIGGQSKRGKYQTHLAFWGEPEDALGWPKVNEEACPGKSGCPYWKMCEDSCEQEAITVMEDTMKFDYDKCCQCFACVVTCMFSGHETLGINDEFFPICQIAMSDSAMAVQKTFKEDKIGYMIYAVDVAPECDCFPWADISIVPDVGIFASHDLIAIDTAFADMVDSYPITPKSRAEQLGLKPGEDKFKAINGFTPRIQLKSGEKTGVMGQMDYELITYEPVLTPETICKHQIREYPCAIESRKYMKVLNIAKETDMDNRTTDSPKPWMSDGELTWKRFDPTQ
jgi:hypothetical protein